MKFGGEGLRVGTDIIEVARIEKSLAKNGFADRVYTKSEQEYFESKNKAKFMSAAGIFAAKESFIKVHGQGCSATDIEVRHKTSGEPYFAFLGELKSYNGRNVSLSISHTKEYATAVAIME